MSGKIIVIEGIDCSGKETQSKLLEKYLKEQGIKCFLMSFPAYDTPTGKIIGGPFLGKPEISESYFEESSSLVNPYISSLYYAADRKYNIGKIEKYLGEGYIVILDRYTTSNMAHQGSKIKNAEERFYMYQWIDKLEFWLLKLPKPDLTIFLHVPYDCSQKLQLNRTNLDNNEKDLEYLKNTEQAYIELSELYNWDKIDCCIKTNELKSVAEIHQNIINKIKEKGFI